jgi:tetratricopeptide (TPR) repeat protein
MTRIFAFWFVVTSACLNVLALHAQTEEDFTVCLHEDLRSPDLAVKGCTAIIEAGRQILERVATAYNNRGVAFRNKQQYGKAIGDFDEAIRLEPHFTTAFNNRAVAYRNMGDLDRALADYNEAIRLQPKYLAAFYNRGLVLMDKGEFHRAIDDFTAVLHAGPPNAVVLYRRSQARAKSGDSHGAKADLAAAQAIRPDIVEAAAQSDR